MIFSLLEDKKKNFIVTHTPDLDVFCFFHHDHAVILSEKLFWKSIYASLRRKKNVLILEEEILIWPTWNSTLRWDIGEHFLWLAPRSLSTIQQTFPSQPPDLSSLKNFLKMSK